MVWVQLLNFSSTLPVNFCRYFGITKLVRAEDIFGKRLLPVSTVGRRATDLERNLRICCLNWRWMSRFIKPFDGLSIRTFSWWRLVVDRLAVTLGAFWLSACILWHAYFFIAVMLSLILVLLPRIFDADILLITSKVCVNCRWIGHELKYPFHHGYCFFGVGLPWLGVRLKDA